MSKSRMQTGIPPACASMAGTQQQGIPIREHSSRTGTFQEKRTRTARPGCPLINRTWDKKNEIRLWGRGVIQGHR
jgi:hypothetical protein